MPEYFFILEVIIQCTYQLSSLSFEGQIILNNKRVISSTFCLLDIEFTSSLCKSIYHQQNGGICFDP